MVLSNKDRHRLETLFTEVICPFAETHSLVVVDGGTDCGVMQLMGQSRLKTGSTFPLLGVVVKSMMTYFPGDTPTSPGQAPSGIESQPFCDGPPLEMNGGMSPTGLPKSLIPWPEIWPP